MFSWAGNRVANLVFFFLSLFGISISICDIFLSAEIFSGTINNHVCDGEEMEYWSPLLTNSLLMILSVWALPIRVTACRVAWQLAMPHHYIKELVKPEFPRFKAIIYNFTRFLAFFCCVSFFCPRLLAKLKFETHHKIHYSIQVILEIILISLVLYYQNYVSLIPPLAGLCGIFASLLSLYKIDILFNSFAIYMSVMLIVIETVFSQCMNLTMANLIVYILLFTVAAILIRLKTIMHAYMQSKEKTYAWLLARDEFSENPFVSNSLLIALPFRIRAFYWDKPRSIKPESRSAIDPEDDSEK